MKILSDLFQPVLQGVAIQEQSNESLRCKVELDVPLGLSQEKLLQLPLLTNIRIYQIDRLADNTLFCKELGGALPLTRSGNLDKAQLAREISSRKRLYPLN